MNDGKKFSSGFTNELKSNKSYIWQTIGFDEFSITSILSELTELTIEKLNHTITTCRDSSFCSAGLQLHAARHHWWIVGPTKIILIDNNSRLVSWNFNPLKRVSMIFWRKSKYFSLSDRIESMKSHKKKILTNRIVKSWFWITNRKWSQLSIWLMFELKCRGYIRAC